MLNQPGTIPEDNLNLEAVSLANMNGDSYTYSWEINPPENMNNPAGANIQTINLKGTTRPFQVINHNSAEVSAYGGHHPASHFNWWDHWPVAQERSDGNLASSSNRPSHTSLSHLRWEHYAQDNGIIKLRTKVMLHGMSDEPVAELVPLARSWEMPPVININSPGFTGGFYDKSQRAHKISRDSEEAVSLQFTLQGSSGSPIVNPCFVIENWWGDDSDFRLCIDGQTIEPGPGVRRGIEMDPNEVPSLVIWIKKDSTSPINITITTSTIIYVDADVPGPVHDGSSWANAYNYLQDALDAAAIYGDEIRVAEGIYTPDANSMVSDSSGDRTATFQLINGVGLYGGFPPGGDTWDQRDPNRYETVLSGDLNGDDGGGMWNFDSSPILTNCTFSGNLASNFHGGGMYNYGFSSGSNAAVTNCSFSRNSAGFRGGGIFNYNSDPNVINCILWGNTATDGGQIYDDGTSSSTVTYSDVQGGGGGTGNINLDPLFVDADGEDDIVGTEDDNLRLMGDSPCIDAGDNTAVPADTADLDGDGDGDTSEQTPWDLDGLPRFFDDRCIADTGNPGAPGRPIVDMGAYKFVRSDIDRNAEVNLADLCLVAMRWLDSGCGVCGWSDLTCDGKVNLEDFAEFVLTRNQLWAGE